MYYLVACSGVSEHSVGALIAVAVRLTNGEHAAQNARVVHDVCVHHDLH